MSKILVKIIKYFISKRIHFDDEFYVNTTDFRNSNLHNNAQTLLCHFSLPFLCFFCRFLPQGALSTLSVYSTVFIFYHIKQLKVNVKKKFFIIFYYIFSEIFSNFFTPTLCCMRYFFDHNSIPVLVKVLYSFFATHLKIYALTMINTPNFFFRLFDNKLLPTNKRQCPLNAYPHQVCHY